MTSPAYPQAHALIVGISQYTNIRPLPSAILNDANEISATLASPSYCGYDPTNITKLLDGQATRVAVLSALDDLASKVGVEDTACVFFSGHGGLLAGAQDSWILTVECNPKDLASTSISADEFSQALRNIRAKRLLVFIDACHAGGAGTLKAGEPDVELNYGYTEKSLTSLAVGIGRVLIASSRMSEASLVMKGAKNSAFTMALVEGLRGAADADGSGLIKVFRLFEYISEAVPKATNDQQHPIFKTTDFENNFPVALSRGGKKGLTDTASTTATLPSSASTQDKWATLEATLVALYPMGPNDQQVWSRAGGDLSRLAPQSSGVASWHAALRTLRQGGGGNIRFESLLETALQDFAANKALLSLR